LDAVGRGFGSRPEFWTRPSGVFHLSG